MTSPTPAQIEALYRRLDQEAEAGGYHLNPDRETTLGLVEGLLINEERYGYRACPCRLASGQQAEDLDIICPCDYRDPDLSDYGTCYCSLYVSEEVLSGERKVQPIPERRPEKPQTARAGESQVSPVGMTVWRCRVCGYLCAREKPPGVCPICKAGRERFEPLRLAFAVL